MPPAMVRVRRPAGFRGVRRLTAAVVAVAGAAGTLGLAQAGDPVLRDRGPAVPATPDRPLGTADVPDPAAEDEEVGDEAEVARHLPPPGAGPEQVVASARRLADAGAPAVPAVFRKLVGATGTARDALLGALATIDRDDADVEGILALGLRRGGPAAPWAAAVLVRGALPREHRTDAVLDLVSGDIPGGAVPDEVVSAAERALGRAFVRDADAAAAVAGRWSDLPAGVRTAAVRAAAGADVPGTDRILVDAAVHGGEPGRLAMSLVGPRAERLPPDLRRRLAERAAAVLRDGSPGDRAAACTVLGWAQAEESVESLVAALEAAPTEDVRRAAGWALRHLTGLALRDDARPWRRWLRDEVAWSEQRRAKAVGDLGSRDARTRNGALAEIEGRRLRRSALAQEVALLLGHEEAAVRARACAALGRLGGPVAADALARAAEDPSDEVRAAAAAGRQQGSGDAEQ